MHKKQYLQQLTSSGTVWFCCKAPARVFGNNFIVVRIYFFSLRKTFWRLLKKIGIELSSGPAVPLLADTPKELKGETRLFSHPCSSQHFFTIAQRRKQPKRVRKRQSSDELTSKTRTPSPAWMRLEDITLTKPASQQRTLLVGGF